MNYRKAKERIISILKSDMRKVKKQDSIIKILVKTNLSNKELVALWRKLTKKR